MVCPHEVCEAAKFNVRAEGPRDNVDMLFSMKHPPNVVVCDMAHMVARHANLRQNDFFSPYQGRVAEPTEENITQAKAKELHIDLSWLEGNNHSNVEQGDELTHPITGSSDRLCLVDKFHERNIKNPKEILRRVDNVIQLCLDQIDKKIFT